MIAANTEERVLLFADVSIIPYANETFPEVVSIFKQKNVCLNKLINYNKRFYLVVKVQICNKIWN